MDLDLIKSEILNRVEFEIDSLKSDLSQANATVAEECIKDTVKRAFRRLTGGL